MNKNVSIIGVGRLGLCLALNLERKGYNVIGVDVIPEYVDALNKKKFDSPEPEVNGLLKTSKNFKATTDLKEALQNDILFVVVHTPSLKSGKFDHQYIDRIVNGLIQLGVQPTKKHLVISSTTEPGYCNTVYDRLRKFNYEVVYNPEFIAQGSIIRDQLRPDIVLVGTLSDESFKIVKDLYWDICVDDMIVYRMTPTEAEITKIALNCFITTKITFANMVGDVALKLGLQEDIILKAIGADSRIGPKCLKYGFGFGGPCFPRDNKMFGIFCEENGVYPHISYATDKSNQTHLINQVNEYVKNHDKDEILILKSVTYKPNTDIIEESQKLKFAEELVRRGYRVAIRDNERVINQLTKIYGDKFTYEVATDVQ